MSKSPPVVYILHGEDEFAIAQFLAGLIAKLGDSTVAVMNTTRLDGHKLSLEELRAATSAVPFLAARRLVIVTHPLAGLKSQTARKKFRSLLETTPASTALVLVEHRSLTEERARKKGNINWLEKWAMSAGERVYVRHFRSLKGSAMARWIQDRAKSQGGQITPRAAALLASLVENDARLASQEIEKLLTYVNDQRAVEPDDVELLTAYMGQGDIFAMVDALGNKDGRQAMRMLHRLLGEKDPLSIFGMVVRQFRLLLLSREVLDRGGREGDVARELKVHPYVAGKVAAQAQKFSLPVLEAVYHRLLAVDEAIKTGQIRGDLALDTFIAAFTTQ